MFEPAGSFAPIHHRPPAVQIISTPVFMFQIVGVLPHPSVDVRLERRIVIRQSLKQMRLFACF